MFWLKKPIQAVPSACSKGPPVGKDALRSKMPMLSSPRKPPSNTLLPIGSSRFTHQVKFSNSLLNADFEELHVGLAAHAPIGAIDEQGRKGVDRRVHVAEIPFIGGNLSARMQIDPFSMSSISCFAKSGSTIESARVWNARSHAAYQGYSHLSGIERMPR